MRNGKLTLENKSDLPMVQFIKIVVDIIEDGYMNECKDNQLYISAFKIGEVGYSIGGSIMPSSAELTLYKDK